jgi:hypothetical protein
MRICLLSLTMSLFATVLTGCGNPAPPKPNDAAPEAVYRQFMLALVPGKQAEISALILDHPEAEILWVGQPYPTSVAAALAEQYRTMQITRDPSSTDDRVVLNSSAVPAPMTVVQADGTWKLDAGPLIKLRKMVAEFKSK